MNGPGSVDHIVNAFHDILFSMYDRNFPLQTKTVTNNNEPWYSDKLTKLDRRRRREYNKHRRSEKYLSLEKIYKEELSKAKKSFYSNKIEMLKKSNPRLWYSNLKRLIKYDPKGDIIEVDNIKDLSDIDQAEEIASKFAEISHLYNPVDRNQIEMATVDEKDVLKISIL